MRHRLALTLLLISLVLPGIAGIRFVKETDNEAFRLRILEQNLQGLTLSFDIQSFYQQSVDREEGQFDLVVLGSEGFTEELGKARLPVIRRFIQIPEATDLELEILNIQTEIYSLSELGIENPILPVQPPIPKTQNHAVIPFRMNQDFYRSTEFYPGEDVRIAGIFQMRAYRGALLEFYPIHYSPANNQVKVISRIEIRIKFRSSDQLTTQSLQRQFAHPQFDFIASQIFLNQESFKSSFPPVPIHYLFIVGDVFSGNPKLLEYIEWKKQKGFWVTVKTVSELGGTANSILNYISTEYNAGNPPAYIQLVGDVNDMPTFSGDASGSATDVDYTQITPGDFIPDIIIGRFSATNESQLNILIDKALKYETLDYPSLAHLNKVTFISTNDSRNWELVEATHEYVIQNHIIPNDIQYDHIKGHSGGTTTDISTALNNGRIICHYSGHGSTTAWQGPAFTATNINALTNSNLYPFVVSNACLTGSFQLTECFGENWVRANDKGAFAFLGASNNSYWDEDDWMERKMYDGYFDESNYGIGAMTQIGLLEVYSHGVTNAEYYFDIYNVLGDASTFLWMGNPREPVVTNEPEIPVGATEFAVDVEVAGKAEANVLVALYSNGVLHGSAYTDISGQANIYLDNPPTEPGELTLTVTGYNLIPFITNIQAVHPAVVVIEPSLIPVETPSDVQITVYEADGITPMEGLLVWLSGWGINPDTHQGTTDDAGQVTIPITPPFGETLQVQGQESEGKNLVFSEELPVVGALDLIQADILPTVPELGMSDSLAVGWEGVLTGECSQSGFTLFARGCGVDISETATSLDILPMVTGTVTTVLAKSGYQIYQETVSVIEAMGTFTGTVADESEVPLAGAAVNIYPASDLVNPVYSGVTAANGTFGSTHNFPVGDYWVEVKLFGFQDYSDTFFLQYNANEWQVEMQSISSSQVSGTVTESETGNPLDAVIDIYRPVNSSWILYLSVPVSALSGGAYSIELPFASYLFNVSTVQHRIYAEVINIDVPVKNLDFVLEPTQANILLVDDDSGKRYDKKDGIKPAGLVEDKTDKGIAATTLAEDLTALGYYVVTEISSTTNPATWLNYDLLISSSGADASPVEITTYRTALENYVSTGGKLLIEGGEIGYRAADSPRYPSFASNVLHINSWVVDRAGHLNRYLEQHPMVTSPNLMDSRIEMNYVNYGDMDACRPMSDAYHVYYNNSDTSQAGIIVYDNNPFANSAQIVYYTFAYHRVVSSTERKALLENTLNFLLSPDNQSTGKISGTVDLIGTQDNSGAQVELLGTDFYAISNTSGDYLIENIIPGTYTVKSQKMGYTSAQVAGVEVEGDQITSGVNFALEPLQLVFSEDFEHGTACWNFESTWGLSNIRFYSQWYSMTDSPGSNYTENRAGWSAELLTALATAESSEGLLRFWHRYRLGTGDTAHVEVSQNEKTWQRIQYFTGTQEEWIESKLLLSDYLNADYLWLRFRTSADAENNLDGWYIDDIKILLDQGSTVLPGDINFSGSVDITDIILAINYILQTVVPTPMEFWAADINGDQQLNILDVVALVGLILKDAKPERQLTTSREPAQLFMKNNQLYLRSDGEIAGLELHLRPGQSVPKVSNNIPAQSRFNKTGTGTIILFYNPDLATFPAGEIPLLECEDTIEIQSAFAADVNGAAVELLIATAPEGYRLYANYPNPFNPETRIAFEIPEPNQIKLTIFNLHGEEVINLMDRWLSPGYYTTVWNGRDAKGNAVSSGVYLYQLHGPGMGLIRKMLLVK